MKKIVYLLAPLMCFSTLVGCKTGGDEPDPKPTNTYTVKFMSEGAEFASQEVKENGHATRPEKNPTKAGSEQYTYTFNEWQLDGKGFDFNTPIVKDITLTADFTESLTQYTVKWFNKEGDTEPLYTKKVEYGTVPEYDGPTPTMSGGKDEFHCYEFDGWNREFEEVHSDQSYIAKFKDVIDPSVTQLSISLDKDFTFKFKASVVEGENILIDWDDDSNVENSISESGVYEHEYSSGDYDILVKNITSIKAYGDYSTESDFRDPITSVKFGNSVNTIGDSQENDAFRECKSLTSVEIPGSVGIVWRYVFKNCELLKTVKINEGVNQILTSAFEGCGSLESIVLPDSLTVLQGDAFYGDENLISVKIGDGLTKIYDRAFKGCSSLEHIEIGSKLESFSNDCFEGCSSINSIIIDENNENFDSRDNCNAIITKKDLEISGKTINANTLLFGCKTTSIPSNVTSIYDYAFSGVSHSGEFEISDFITSIGRYSFSYSNDLTSFKSGSGLTSIGTHAFYNTPNLNYVDLSAVDDIIQGQDGMFGYNRTSEFRIYIKTQELIDKYKEMNYWKVYSDYLSLPPSSPTAS